jgi:hypothetical protein
MQDALVVLRVYLKKPMYPTLLITKFDFSIIINRGFIFFILEQLDNQ